MPHATHVAHQPRFDLDQHDAAAYARDIVRAAQASDRPTQDPPSPQYSIDLPLAWLLGWCPLLPPSSQTLLLHLAAMSQRFTGQPGNRWFFRPDRDLRRDVGLASQSGLSQPSLWRARRDLRAQGLIYHSSQTNEGRATYYAMTWPPPMPPQTAPDHCRRIVAREIQRGGEPWPPAAAWQRLCAYVAGDQGAYGADLLLSADTTPALMAAIDFFDRIPTSGPWLRREALSWALPHLLEYHAH
jgi:hypothetical protein